MRRRRGCYLLGLRRAPGLRSTSGQLPRVARTAARRAQGPLSGPFGKGRTVVFVGGIGSEIR